MSTRREFITLLGGTTVWPVAARAQQPASVGLAPVAGDPSIGIPQGGETGLSRPELALIRWRAARRSAAALRLIVAAGGVSRGGAPPRSGATTSRSVWDRRDPGRPAEPQSPGERRVTFDHEMEAKRLVVAELVRRPLRCLLIDHRRGQSRLARGIGNAVCIELPT